MPHFLLLLRTVLKQIDFEELDIFHFVYLGLVAIALFLLFVLTVVFLDRVWLI